MPFPNEHAARQADPGKFDRFRRTSENFPDGISAIFGIKDGKSEIQSLRFDRKKWSPAEARQWLKNNNFKVSGFEVATNTRKQIKCPEGQTYSSVLGRCVEKGKI